MFLVALLVVLQFKKVPTSQIVLVLVDFVHSDIFILYCLLAVVCTLKANGDTVCRLCVKYVPLLPTVLHCPRSHDEQHKKNPAHYIPILS